MHFDTIILGGGPGGITASRELAAGGKSVALVEDLHWGGTCLNWGCIPSKLLLGAVAPKFLLHGHERLKVMKGEINIDFNALHNRVQRFTSGASQSVGKALAAAGVTLFSGKGTLTGKGKVRVVTEKGSEDLEGTDIILACGSRNAVFPGLAADGDAVLDSTGMLNLDTVPESLLIVGGGAIGLEMADFFGGMGSEITIVEAAPQIAPTEDADIAGEMLKAQTRAGRKCLIGVRAESLSTRDGRAELVLEDGRVLTAARALVAVGRSPNTDGLGCEVAGCGLDRRGYIVANEFLEAAPGVYAVGDVNGRTLLAHAAVHQAMYVAHRILGRATAVYDAGPVPSCIYGGIEVMRIGKTVRELLQEGRQPSVSQAALTMNPISQAYGNTFGFVKAVWDGDTLVAFAAIGHGVSHLITAAQLLLLRGTTLANIHEVMFAHPTLDEILPAAIRAPRVSAG